MASVVQEGDVVAAEQWFSRMQMEGISPNVITFGTLINGYAGQGNAVQATAWFMRMQNSGIAPNSTTFSSLINAYAKNSDPAGEHRSLLSGVLSSHPAHLQNSA